jgi:ankyrin repeat protein
MQSQSETQNRALDAQCGDLASPAACRAIRELRAMSAENQNICANNFAIFNCNNLLRCALAAGVSARSYSQGIPLLSIAAEYGSLRPMLTLLAAGADPNASDRRIGNTALNTAIGFKHPECCGALLDVSDLGLTNRLGRNALHVCVSTANQECFELLLPRVGDVDARTVPGVDEHGTPL